MTANFSYHADTKAVNRYPLTFKAAVLERTGDPLVIEEVTFGGPLQLGQVLVRVLYSGICGKQIEEIEGSRGTDPHLPHLLGHEGSGIVIEVGPGVTKLVKGDHVVLHWMKGQGITSATPIYTRGKELVNAGWVTTFNEYGVVSENRLTAIPKDADLASACLLGCAVTTGVGVILNDPSVRPGDSVAVFGCGGVGLNTIQGAFLAGMDPIIAIDKNPESLCLAQQLGATHTIHVDSCDAVLEVIRITNGRGASHVIVAIGSAGVMESAARASSVPGSVVLVGVPPAGSNITFDALDIHLGRTVKGSYGGSSIPDRDIPEYLRLNHQGQLKLRELITDIVELDQINDAIGSMISGRSGRCLVKMTDEQVHQGQWKGKPS